VEASLILGGNRARAPGGWIRRIGHICILVGVRANAPGSGLPTGMALDGRWSESPPLDDRRGGAARAAARRAEMRTVQMTLGEDLVERVDRMVKKLGTTR
jgi:hypothetical protein